MNDRSVRLGVALLLALAALAAWDGSRALEARIGTPYPGFYVDAGGLVVPSFRGALRATLAESGLQPLDQVVSVDGTPIARARDVYDAAARAGAGSVLRYGVRGPDGALREVAVAARPLTAAEAPPLAVFFGIGTLFLLIGAAPVLARPALGEARLFFVFSWAMAGNFGFLSLDHILLHRLQPASFVVTAAALATLLHLAFSFPQRRWPLREGSDRAALFLYGFAALSFTAFAVLYLVRPLATYRAALAGLAFYPIGGLLLLANAVATLARPRDAVHRERALVVCAGPALASAVTVAAMAASGATLRDVLAGGFTAGLSVLPPAIAWATFQHDLFSLDTVVRRGLALGGAVLLASLAYLGAFAGLRQLFGVETAWASAGLSLALLFALVPLAQPLAHRLERRVDALFFPSACARGARCARRRAPSRTCAIARASRRWSRARCARRSAPRTCTSLQAAPRARCWRSAKARTHSSSRPATRSRRRSAAGRWCSAPRSRARGRAARARCSAASTSAAPRSSCRCRATRGARRRSCSARAPTVGRTRATSSTRCVRSPRRPRSRCAAPRRGTSWMRSSGACSART